MDNLSVGVIQSNSEVVDFNPGSIELSREICYGRIEVSYLFSESSVGILELGNLGVGVIQSNSEVVDIFVANFNFFFKQISRNVYSVDLIFQHFVSSLETLIGMFELNIPCFTSIQSSIHIVERDNQVVVGKLQSLILISQRIDCIIICSLKSMEILNFVHKTLVDKGRLESWNGANIVQMWHYDKLNSVEIETYPTWDRELDKLLGYG